jgi:HEPN domain-containing protein
MKRLTKEWEKAEADYRSANVLAREKLPLHDAVCFHCQQCAEKYLKALLQESGAPVPRTHELVTLLSLVTTHYPLRGIRRGVKFLTDFAVEFRYPPVRATKRQAIAALRWATKLRDGCRAQLNV